MDQPFESFGPELAAPRPSLGLVGIGAFGAFAVPHLRRHFDCRIADDRPDLEGLAATLGVDAVGLDEIGPCDIVVLAVPLSALELVAGRLSPHLRPGTLVIDVCSVKQAPAEILRRVLPAHVDIVGTHPLFGPQSGRDGIAGLPVAVCPVRGRRAGTVARFLAGEFGLHVSRMSAEAHDREMAHVQGLTHLIARILRTMRLPSPGLKTRSFAHLEELVGLVGQDSEALFRTILLANPFAGTVTADFVAATASVLDGLAVHGLDAQPAQPPAQQTGFVAAPASA